MALRLSQAELALKCGIRTNTQGHYESGFRVPRADYLQRLSVIGLDAHYILFGTRMTVHLKELSLKESTILMSLRTLSLSDRDAVERILEIICRSAAQLKASRA